MKNKLVAMVSTVILLVFSVLTIGCKETIREGGEPLKTEATLVEAVHTPSSSELKLGYHYSISKHKMVSGYRRKNTPEKNFTSFRGVDGEIFETASREICTKFTNAPSGIVVNIVYRNLFDVTYDGKTVIEKRQVGFEVLEAEVK